MKNSKSFKFIDLFAGIGGFHLGLSEFGGECVFASEIDEHASLVYEKNFKIRPHGDIRNIETALIPNHDVLTAGFPCQAFSVAGKRLGFKDSRGTLFFEIVRVVKDKKPKVLLLENVRNFLVHNKGETFKVVQKNIEQLGYTLFYQILNSSDFGVPQARKRIYMVAFRNDLKIKEFNFPTSNGQFKIIKDILIPYSKDKIKDLIIKRQDISFYRKENELKKNSRPFQIGRINKGGQGERIYSIHAQGITLSAFGGGAAAKTGAYLIAGKVRKLHPKECLKMQGFPHHFKLGRFHSNSYKQLGNAVSVPVVKAIVEEILKTIPL